MCTEDFIIELFCRVDQKMAGVRRHAQAALHPSEVVTLALLLAFKGTSGRAFYRWLTRDWLCLFHRLPDRTRLLRLFAALRRFPDGVDGKSFFEKRCPDHCPP